MRRLGVAVLSLLAIALLVGAARRRAVAPHPQTLNLDARRSFAVTDQAILDGFSFQRVMEAIVARSGTRTPALQLYQQMFDTQNKKPGLVAPDAPHCDDFLVEGKPAFNGFPRRCPTPEGALATSDPFPAGDVIPLALINRFDMTAVDGSNCGQYRVIFAKKTGNFLDRVHLIFEANLPNPTPSAGVAGCRAVAEFWAGLTSIDSISQRRAELERFFFTGLPGFEPVFDSRHYSVESGGGIRTMFGSILTFGVLNRFYQFRLTRACTASGCSLIAEPDVLENMPIGRFFNASIDTPDARVFREKFIRQVPSLAIRDVNLYFMNISRPFLMAESDPVDGELEFIYAIPFLKGLLTPAGRDFSDRIVAELKRAGSTLTPAQIITRAETQTCTGCHVLSGAVGESVVFPRSAFPYEHVSETLKESGEAGQRFAISPAMRDVFIPHRMEVLRRFLTSGSAPVHSNAVGDDAAGMTLGGGRRVQ